MDNSKLDPIIEKLKIQYDTTDTPEYISKSVSSSLEKLPVKKKSLKLKIITGLAAVFMLIICARFLSKMQIVPETKTAGIYPIALQWNNALYCPSTNIVLDAGLLDLTLGKITKVNYPMPQKSGEVNCESPFPINSKICSIKGVEVTEAIGILNDGKFYRIDRMRSSLSIVFDGKIYDFDGNFDENDQKDNLDKMIGEVIRIGISAENAQDGDITLLGVESSASDFFIGGKIYLLKDTPDTAAIAVEDKRGKYQKATYVKRAN